ncbi:Leo1-like protein-domain-containing protein [Amylocarpus encephaloides]|uniref:Leo1-like protein-domain-containing protein n=1 Tax=Amylocarpus encephaloides TaxID=45428 RepID=A0A9P7YM83_9HELO|nr:Leo1-like protein-domain-containing protein [Amylocarpus encephaloides]
MASSDEDVVNSEQDVDQDDLFGDEEDEELEAAKPRELDDEDLDSGDDEHRVDRVQKYAEDYPDDDGEGERLEYRISEQTVPRHPLPKPVDGEFNAFRLPKFLGIEPRAYTPDTFKIRTTDHHSDKRSNNFSPSATTLSTMRYRKDSAGNLESNTVVYKWSDGSTTICVGDQHYELQTKPLAPPRDSKPYLEVQDSHSYLATPSIAAQVLILFGHMTNEYTVRPNKSIEDDALEKLQKSMAAATRKGDSKNGPEMIINTQDPELQKKKAELAEKERMKLQRRRETAAEKAVHGGSRRGAAGLTVGELEGGRSRGPGAGRKAPKRSRRSGEYDTDDDELPSGKGKQDEYDKEDGFLASSDEELEVGEDDDEEEILDDSERDEPKPKKRKTSRVEETSDADAEADLDDDEAPPASAANDGPAGRGRKRNVIEDEDDE